MDISQVAGYSSINSRNASPLTQSGAQQQAAVDPSKSALMSYISGQRPVTSAIAGMDTPSVTGDLVESSAIAQARQAQAERESLERQEERDAKALEQAKAALENIKSRPLALKFDTIKDFNNAQVLRVVDAHSEELIRQIPSDELLRVSTMISSYKERLAQESMTTDPQLKSKGITTNAQESENLRGVVLDDLI